jgi:hypothetical protein
MRFTPASITFTFLFACALTGCSSSVGTSDGSVDAAADVPTDTAPNPCMPGTCRFRSDPSAPCLPPGGPITPPDSGTLSGCCSCGSDGFCGAECVCASPETPIATPDGERAIESLHVGDLVYSVHEGRVVAVPLREVRRRPVSNHIVVRVTLDDGRVLDISAAHPTADGRTFGGLHAGDWLGGRTVLTTQLVPFQHEATYDILPDSDTATYFANGALIGSTLAPTAHRPSLLGPACAPPDRVR